MTDGTFTPRDVIALIKQKELPAVVLIGWRAGTKQDAEYEVVNCLKNEQQRKTCGVVFVFIAVALFGFVTYAVLRRTPEEDATVLILTLVGYFGGCAAVAGAWHYYRYNCSSYFDFAFTEKGFGWNLSWLLNYLNASLKTLFKMNLVEVGELAFRVLVEQAKLVHKAEGVIKAKLDSSYVNRDWKYNPEWDTAKKKFVAKFDVFFRFGLVNEDAYKAAFDVARAELVSAA